MLSPCHFQWEQRAFSPLRTQGVLKTFPQLSKKHFPHAVQVLLAVVSRRATFADTVLIIIRNHYREITTRGHLRANIWFWFFLRQEFPPLATRGPAVPPLLHLGGTGSLKEIKKAEEQRRGSVMFLRIALCLGGSGRSGVCIGWPCHRLGWNNSKNSSWGFVASVTWPCRCGGNIWLAPETRCQGPVANPVRMATFFIWKSEPFPSCTPGQCRQSRREPFTVSLQWGRASVGRCLFFAFLMTICKISFASSTWH